MSLPPALPDWLLRQRWAPAQTPPDNEPVEIISAQVEDGLRVGWWLYGPAVRGGAADDRLLLCLASCLGPAPVTDWFVDGELSWFDALSHPGTAAHAINLLSAARADLALTWLDESALQLSQLRAISVDQSNTTLLTDHHALKIFRRVQPGRNPEIEIGAALRSRGSAHTAALSGWISLSTAHGPLDLLAVHRRIDGSNGFDLARADAQRRAGGIPEQHFGGAAYELGIAVGAVHADLADAFGQQVVPAYGAELSTRLLRRLQSLRDVDVLAPYLDSAETIFTDLARLPDALSVHRIHGDLHLGQVLFTDDGWRLIDFEGEPARGLADRAAPDTPIRDLAGVLRSFDYAARWDGSQEVRALWCRQACDMFLEGYALQRPDALNHRVLDALVLDKALYEVGYEATYRPQHLRIPLAAIAGICGTSSAD